MSVVDVRDADEIAADGGIPGARHVPLADVLADPGRIAAPGLVIVCQSGVRARRAAEALVTAGFEAAVLAGGMDAWLRTRVGIDGDARSRVEATAP
ncbi:MAG: rhodanese-like domain-containing protein [Actinobacteria bacterium]|nr:rhodanese-like domain-containing protein [Actinomycetota bacterium]